MKNIKVIFFINGSVPTAKELEIAENINGKVCFRNANFIDENACLESCDYVTGSIPKSYNKIAKLKYKKNEKEGLEADESDKLPLEQDEGQKEAPGAKQTPGTGVVASSAAPAWKPN